MVDKKDIKIWLGKSDEEDIFWNPQTERSPHIALIAGSGSTCKACEKLGRKWIGIELDERWLSGIEQLEEQLGYGVKEKSFPEHILKEINRRKR